MSSSTRAEIGAAMSMTPRGWTINALATELERDLLRFIEDRLSAGLGAKTVLERAITHDRTKKCPQTSFDRMARALEYGSAATLKARSMAYRRDTKSFGRSPKKTRKTRTLLLCLHGRYTFIPTRKLTLKYLDGA